MSNGALEKSQRVSRHLSEAARKARFSLRARSRFQGRAGRRAFGIALDRLVWLACFFGVLVIPLALLTVYFAFIASDQFMSETRFAVRGGQKPVPDSLQALTGIPSVQIVQDTQIVTSFLTSRTMVEQLEDSVGLRQRFSRPEIDWWSRFNPENSTERLVRYWKSMVSASIEMPAGVVIVSVRAYSAEDAAAIARAVLDRSEALINQMNQRMLKDTLHVAQTTVERAAARLGKARANVEAVRNMEGTLDAERTGDAMNALLTSLRGEKLKLEQDLTYQLRFVRGDAPQLRSIRAGIAGIDEQIREIEAQLTKRTDHSGPTVATAMTRFSEAEIERGTAEKLYGAAVSSLEIARIAGEGKLLYLTTFVEPVAPDEARYPRRWLLILGSAVVCLLAWLAVNAASRFVLTRLS